MNDIHFDVKFVPAGSWTGATIWDDPQANEVVQRFMPMDKNHGPMIGILHLGALRPTPNVLRNVIVTIGEDIRAGRYGNFTFIVSSEDDATRHVIGDIASAQDLPIFVSSSSIDLEQAKPAGVLTAKERETMNLVLRAGGTVTAAELGQQLGTEQTTAGNRLNALHKKGYLQRVVRPHPFGDQFVDPRSVRFDAKP
jgi:hypothetical protein